MDLHEVWTINKPSWRIYLWKLMFKFLPFGFIYKLKVTIKHIYLNFSKLARNIFCNLFLKLLLNFDTYWLIFFYLKKWCLEQLSNLYKSWLRLDHIILLRIESDHKICKTKSPLKLPHLTVTLHPPDSHNNWP